MVSEMKQNGAALDRKEMPSGAQFYCGQSKTTKFYFLALG